jgi:hypothetical protein
VEVEGKCSSRAKEWSIISKFGLNGFSQWQCIISPIPSLPQLMLLLPRAVPSLGSLYR